MKEPEIRPDSGGQITRHEAVRKKTNARRGARLIVGDFSSYLVDQIWLFFYDALPKVLECEPPSVVTTDLPLRARGHGMLN